MEDFMKPWRPQLLSILRIMAALLILQYGVSKILGFPSPLPPQLQMIGQQAVGAWPGWWAGIIELVLGALLVIGLFSRPVAFVLAGEMAFAYFLGHAGRGWQPLINGGNLAVLFCFVFLYLSAAGPGPWSVDKIFRNKD